MLGKAPAIDEASTGENVILRGLTRLINWSLGRPPTNLPVHYTSTIQSIAFGPDGKLLVSGGIDNTVRLWDVRKKRAIFSHKPNQKGVSYANVQTVAFSPNSEVFASAGTHKEIHLWSATDHKLIGTLNTEEYVETLAFHPDGRFLAAGVKARIRVWDMETQSEVQPLEGSLGRVNTIAFSSDGNTLVGSAGHGVIRVWDTSGLGSD